MITRRGWPLSLLQGLKATKAQATQNGYNRTVGECEIESELGKVSKLITHKIQLTLLAINS